MADITTTLTPPDNLLAWMHYWSPAFPGTYKELLAQGRRFTKAAIKNIWEPNPWPWLQVLEKGVRGWVSDATDLREHTTNLMASLAAWVASGDAAKFIQPFIDAGLATMPVAPWASIDLPAKDVAALERNAQQSESAKAEEKEDQDQWDTFVGPLLIPEKAQDAVIKLYKDHTGRAIQTLYDLPHVRDDTEYATMANNPAEYARSLSRDLLAYSNGTYTGSLAQLIKRATLWTQWEEYSAYDWGITQRGTPAKPWKEWQ